MCLALRWLISFRVHTRDDLAALVEDDDSITGSVAVSLRETISQLAVASDLVGQVAKCSGGFRHASNLNHPVASKEF